MVFLLCIVYSLTKLSVVNSTYPSQLQLPSSPWYYCACMVKLSLDHVRRGPAMRVDRSLIRTQRRWEPYSYVGTVRRKGEGEDVSYRPAKGNGRQVNWEGHVSPDQLPSISALHPTHRQVLEVLMHRAFAQGMTDIKVTNHDIGSIVNRSVAQVERVIKDLINMGFIGSCIVRFSSGERGKAMRYATWRMIRVHYVGFMLRWQTHESATWFRTDFRPDTQRAKHETRSYNMRVGMSNRVKFSWLLKNPSKNRDGSTVAPTIDPMFGPQYTGMKMGYLRPDWCRDHDLIVGDQKDGVAYAVQVVGTRLMNKDLNDRQLVL